MLSGVVSQDPFASLGGSGLSLLIYSLAQPPSEILLSLPPATQDFTNPKQLLYTLISIWSSDLCTEGKL